MKDEPLHPLAEIYHRPGFMIRRAHQIAMSIFIEEAAEHALTPTQHGVLIVASRLPGVDQSGVSRLMGLDKSTAGLVISNLVKRKLVVRTPDEHDGRRHHLRITRAGERTLERVASAVARAQERLLEPFTPAERRTLIELLRRLTESFNDVTRTPVDERAYAMTRVRLGD